MGGSALAQSLKAVRFNEQRSLLLKPMDRRDTFNAPREAPAGQAIIQFSTIF